MNDLLKMSKTYLTFEVDRVRFNKAIDRLELQNPDHNKRKGFKIKSTNISRYVVNPASGIIDPLKTIKIDVMLTLQPDEDISRVQDKFRLYCIDITDDNVTKQNIDQYIRKNESYIKKASIGVKVTERQDTSSKKIDSLSNEPKEQMETASMVSKEQISKPDSVLYESIMPGSQSNVFQESRISNMIPKNNGFESLLIDKENEILKLKETNSMLEKDISMIRGKILLGDQSKIEVRDEKVKVWKLLMILLFGLIIGAALNSAQVAVTIK